MLIRLGYDISFNAPAQVPIVALLNVHPSRAADLREPDELHLEPNAKVDTYIDSFGNICSRFVAPPGVIRLFNSTLIADSGQPDAQNPTARQVPVGDLPTDTLRFLLASRYCELDLLSNTATELFGNLPPTAERVHAICNWVNCKVTFGYNFARPTKTALDVYAERVGVCRDFQHLAITFCRCLNIPARYASGYLGDIGVPAAPYPMDFSAWFEAYLEDRWWTFDARHNVARQGRVLMAVGRDAADAAMTTSFGAATLTNFTVVSDEVTNAQAAKGVSSS